MSASLIPRALLATGILVLSALLGGARPTPTRALGPTAHCPDFNADQAVDAADIALVVQQFGAGIRDQAWYPGYDLSLDGAVSVADIALTVARFGAVCPGEVVAKPFEVVDQDHCQGIRAHEPTLRVARTADELAALWTECAFGSLPLPPVDLDTEMVVGVVATRESSGYALRIKQIAVGESEAIVSATFAWPGQGCVVAPAFMNTSQIVKVQRTDLPLSLAVKKAVAYCSIETIAAGTTSALGAHPPEVRVAGTPEEWQALWQEHAGDTDIAMPDVEIDFESEMVVGVFDTRPTRGYGISVSPFWTLTAAEAILSVWLREPTPECPVEKTPTQPYHFVKLRRVDLPVRAAVTSYSQPCDGPILLD